MQFGLKKPCKTCPFVKDHDFRLTPGRIMEIRDADHFSCHNTVDYSYEDDDEPDIRYRRNTDGEQTCTGWLIVQWAQFEGFPSFVGFAASMGMFDPHELPSAEEAGCFESFEAYAEREGER